MTKKVVKVKCKLVIMKNRVVRMKGMVVMIGYIKGCEIKTLSSRKIRKDGFTALLGEEVRETALCAAENKGMVYGLYNKQKECCAVMIFCREAREINGSEQKVLVLTESAFAEGCEVEFEEFKGLIRRELNEFLFWSDVKYYIIGDEITDYETLKAEMNKKSNGGMIFLFIMIGIITKNFGLAIALMILFGCSPFSALSGSGKNENDGKETVADAT
jgi:hypothetical protein